MEWNNLIEVVVLPEAPSWDNKSFRLDGFNLRTGQAPVNIMQAILVHNSSLSASNIHSEPSSTIPRTKLSTDIDIRAPQSTQIFRATEEMSTVRRSCRSRMTVQPYGTAEKSNLRLPCLPSIHQVTASAPV
jgi:hypothetical protein